MAVLFNMFALYKEALTDLVLRDLCFLIQVRHYSRKHIYFDSRITVRAPLLAIIRIMAYRLYHIPKVMLKLLIVERGINILKQAWGVSNCVLLYLVVRTHWADHFFAECPPLTLPCLADSITIPFINISMVTLLSPTDSTV